MCADGWGFPNLFNHLPLLFSKNEMKPRRTKSKASASFSPAEIAAATHARDGAQYKTPDIVLDAFLPERIAVNGLPFKPANMARLMQIQLAAPGILRKTNAEDFDLAEIAAAAFILSQDEDVTEDLLGTRAIDTLTGKISFPRFKHAVFQLAKNIEPKALVALGQAIDQTLVAATKPAMPFGVDKGTDTESPFPQAPTPDRGSAGS